MKILHINLRLPIELHRQLKELAEKEKRSLQKQIIYILAQYVARQQKGDKE